MTKSTSTQGLPADSAILERALRDLATQPSQELHDRIFDRFVVVPGPITDVFVAFGQAGVRYVTLADPKADNSQLIDDYERQHGRPLLAGSSPPAGLLESLRAGKPGRLRVDLSALTPFERAVLDKTSEIPRGEVRPYSWVASEIGRPKAVRATGSALARNPAPLVIPCHRVIKADGTTGNYGLGVAMKVELLRIEGVDLDTLSQCSSRHERFLGSDTTHIVCYPTCRAAKKITKAHRVAFSTLVEAVTHGYRPCTFCRPVEFA